MTDQIAGGENAGGENAIHGIAEPESAGQKC